MPAKNCHHFNKCMYQDQMPCLCSPTKCGYYEKVKNFTDAQQLKAAIALVRQYANVLHEAGAYSLNSFLTVIEQRAAV